MLENVEKNKKLDHVEFPETVSKSSIFSVLAQGIKKEFGGLAKPWS